MITLLPWLYLLLTIAIGVAMIGAGVGYVRRAHPTAGYLLAGAGAITVLGACCSRGLWMFLRSEGQYDLMSVAALLTYGRVLLVVILAAVAIVMLANRLRDRKPPPRDKNPPPVVF